MARIIPMLFLLAYCRSDEVSPVSQLIVLRDVPPGGDANPPHHLIVRSPFQGSIEFIEADEFRVEINVTAPSGGELAKLQYNYTNDDDGSILLHLYEEDPPISSSPILFIMLAIGGVTVLSFAVTLSIVWWWMKVKKEEVEAATCLTNPDSSQAPLLERLPQTVDTASPDVVHKVKKRHKRTPVSSPSVPCYPASASPTPDPPACLYGVQPTTLPARPTPPAPAPPKRGPRNYPAVEQSQELSVQTMPAGGSAHNMPDIVRGRNGCSSLAVGMHERTIPVADSGDIWLPDNGTTADDSSHQSTSDLVNGDETLEKRPITAQHAMGFRAVGNGSQASGSSSSVATVIAASEGKRGEKIERKGTSPYTHVKYLHATVVCCLSILLVATVTSARMPSATKVTIRVFAPANFLTNKPELYVSRWQPVNVTISGFDQHKLDVQHFEVDDTKGMQPNRHLCYGNMCTQGCDSHSGQCVCRHGYYLKDGYLCEDINECLSRPSSCDRNYAQCFNMPGSYRCACIEGYYGDGVHCKRCNEPCPDGMFEVMPCTDKDGKLCAKCAKSCMQGYYIAALCTPTQNTQCKVCQDNCDKGEYEFAACHHKMNRECRRIDSLPKPIMSKRLIYEDRRHAKEDMSHTTYEKRDSDEKPQYKGILARSDKFSVEIELLDSNLAPVYEPVDHSESNDNDEFYGDASIRDEFCPYPIPEKYKLTAKIHRGVTTAAKAATCPPTGCSGAGFYLDPDHACKTYDTFGKMPQLATEGTSVLCSQPGRLVDSFSLSDSLSDVTTMFVDKTINCAEQRKNCDSCSEVCARRMQRHRVSNACNVTADDTDNGLSPRLAYCHTCCQHKNCTQLCQVYTNKACDRLRCVTGNVAQITLVPQFSPTSTVFACHVKPLSNYSIYDVRYRLLHHGKPVTSKWLRATRRVDADSHPVRSRQLHNFLQIFYGSHVTVEADLVQGDAFSRKFTAGHYQASGPSIDADKIAKDGNVVRSVRPFAVSSKRWKKESCDSTLLSQLISATGSAPYKPVSQLSVQTKHGRYRLFNTTAQRLPFLYFQVSRNASAIRPMFPATRIDENGLSAILHHQKELWVLTVNITLQACPGAVEVKVLDPAYPSMPLYHYDIGVKCPLMFSLTFKIPTRDSGATHKRYDVDITDSHRTIKLKVIRPATVQKVKTKGSTVDNNGHNEKKMSIFTPFLMAVFIIMAIIILLILLAYITDKGDSCAAEDNSSSTQTDNYVHSYHLLFVVILVTFKAAYSTAVTFSVLFLLIGYVNRDSSTTLAGFSRYSSSAANTKLVMIGDIQSEAMREIERQNLLANETKSTCEKKLELLQHQLEKAKQTLVVKGGDTELVSQMALRYTKLMMKNLTKNVEKFKVEFSKYASDTLDKLTRSMAQTSTSLEANRWLAGPKMLHETVRERRKARGATTKSFLDWLGLEQQMKRLSADLSITDFPLPDFVLPDASSIHLPPPSPVLSSSNPLPRNLWQVDRDQLSEPQPASTSTTPPAEGASRWWLSLAVLLVLDLVWFVHRMSCTYTTARILLYGRSTVKCALSNGQQPHNNGSLQSPQPFASSRGLHFMKRLNLKIMKTEFVPKFVTMVTVFSCVYVAMTLASNLLSVKTLTSIGYFESIVSPVQSSYQVAMAHVNSNSERINSFEFPLVDQLANVRVKRSQLILDLYTSLQRYDPYGAEQCAWRHLLGENCVDGLEHMDSPTLQFDGCDFIPVTPLQLQHRDFEAWRNSLAHSILPYINASRQVVMDTCYIIVVFVSALALVDSFGAALWIYLKKFGMIRQRPLFALSQPPKSAQ